MGATNAKMDFGAFGVRGIEKPRLRLCKAYVKGVLRFEPKTAKNGQDLTGWGATGKVSER
jgi:hypothetical protein